MAIKKSKDSNVIDVYSWPTPNGHKVHIMLEECGYKLGRDWIAHPIDIGAGDQPLVEQQAGRRAGAVANARIDGRAGQPGGNRGHLRRFAPVAVAGHARRAIDHRGRRRHLCRLGAVRPPARRLTGL